MYVCHWNAGNEMYTELSPKVREGGVGCAREGQESWGHCDKGGLMERGQAELWEDPQANLTFTGRHCDGMLLKGLVTSTLKISFREGKLPTSPAASPGFVGKDGCTGSQVNRHHTSHTKRLMCLLVLNPNSYPRITSGWNQVSTLTQSPTAWGEGVGLREQIVLPRAHS